MTRMQDVEDNLWESVFSLYHVSAWFRTQIIRVSGKHLAPLSHLASPSLQFLCVSSSEITQQQLKQGFPPSPAMNQRAL